MNTPAPGCLKRHSIHSHDYHASLSGSGFVGRRGDTGRGWFQLYQEEGEEGFRYASGILAPNMGTHLAWIVMSILPMHHLNHLPYLQAVPPPDAL